MGSNIALTIDMTAIVAARVQGVAMPNGEIVGVRSIYGSGNSGYADPLRSGQAVQPAKEKPLEPLCHISEIPDAPTVVPLTQDGVVQFEWSIPMRLYVPRGDLATVRQTLLPFYDAYMAAFWADHTLGGLCNLAYIRSFKPDGDDSWCWLDMDLYVQELVTYG
jgi:hypothetical protein